MTASRWWVVSDLHLAPWGADPRGTGQAFARFLAREVATATGRTHVVLLGDTFELAGLDVRRGRDQLDQLARQNAEVFAQLGMCLRRGVRFHFVCGNHDVDLARPAVAARLVELLSPTDPTERLTVHPWAMHEPGLFFAEHGHQHHLMHRLPTLLLASVSGTDQLDPAPMVALNGWAGGSVGRVVLVGRAFSSARRAERRALTPGYTVLLAAESSRMGLPPQSVRDLWRISRFRTVPAITGTARRLLARWRGGDPNGAGPLAAASQVARILTAHDAPVRWYLTGHTHRAVEASIPGTATQYINPGTWCSDVRGPGPDHDDLSRYPYVLIHVADDGAATAGLRYWRDDQFANAPTLGHGQAHMAV